MSSMCDIEGIADFIRLRGVEGQDIWIDATEIEMVAEHQGGSQIRMQSGNVYSVRSNPRLVLESINASRAP